jgi:hypothetical protein
MVPSSRVLEKCGAASSGELPTAPLAGLMLTPATLPGGATPSGDGISVQYTVAWRENRERLGPFPMVERCRIDGFWQLDGDDYVARIEVEKKVALSSARTAST